MISREIWKLIQTGSEIRKMWAAGIKLKEEHGAANIADMTLGNPVAPPPRELTEALKEIVNSPPDGLHRYTPNAGHPMVREKVAANLDERGILPGAKAGNVILTCGASAATNLAFRAILDPGDEVIILSPYFPDYPAHIMNHRGVPVAVPTDSGFLPDPAAIERAIGPRTRALVLNHPNNPSGREYPRAVLDEVVAVLRDAEKKHGRPVYLLSDEPYREIRYLPEPFVSPARLHEHGLMAYSLSKSHSIPGERIGYLAVNPECPASGELEAATTLANRIMGYTNAPTIWQHVMVRCLDAVVDMKRYREKRDRLFAALLERGYEVPEPDGTFYLFPRTPGGDDKAFVARAMNDLLLVVPGATFGHPGHFRLAYCVDERTMGLALERLPEA